MHVIEPKTSTPTIVFRPWENHNSPVTTSTTTTPLANSYGVDGTLESDPVPQKKTLSNITASGLMDSYESHPAIFTKDSGCSSHCSSTVSMSPSAESANDSNVTTCNQTVAVVEQDDNSEDESVYVTTPDSVCNSDI